MLRFGYDCYIFLFGIEWNDVVLVVSVDWLC